MEPDVYISLELNPKDVARQLNRVLENQMPLDKKWSDAATAKNPPAGSKTAAKKRLTAKFQPHDGDPASVYFSDLVELELKTRGGQTYYGVTQPWLVLGWEHTGSPRDIMEFRVTRGSITKPKDPNANG